MTTCKTLMMSNGAVKLTAVRGMTSGGSVPGAGGEQELARAQAEARERARREVEQLRMKQQGRCRQCEGQIDVCIRKMKDELESRVVEMGLKLAEIVLRHQLPDRVMLESLIRETLQPLSDLRGIRVRVSPAEAGAKAAPGAAGSNWPCPDLSDQVEFMADPALSAGDLVIESRNGIFDARLNERLSLLSEKLEDRLRHSHAISITQSS